MLEQFKNSLNLLGQKLSGWLDGIIVSLPNLVLAAIVIGIAFYAVKYFKKYINKVSGHVAPNRTISGLMSNTAVVTYWIGVVFLTLSVLDLSKTVTSLLAGAGIVGLVVGLAFQEPIINTLSGIMMSVRKYYKIGDLVETNGFFGTIEQISLRSTTIRTPNNQIVVIPNKNVVQDSFKNYSYLPYRRVDVACGVAYDSDLTFVENTVIAAIEKEIDHIEEKGVQFFYKEFGGSSIDFEVHFWIESTQKSYLESVHEAIMAIKKNFDQANIGIPFPTRTLEFNIKDIDGIRSINEPNQKSEVEEIANRPNAKQQKKERQSS